MKIYQKILIGIAAGFLFGALLGPQSLVFEKDTLHVVDPSALEIRTVAEDATTRVVLPKNVVSDFHIVGEALVGDQSWLKVNWKLKAKHLVGAGLTEEGGEVVKPGDERVSYIHVKNLPPRSSSLGLKIIAWVAPLGEIFLRLILMLVVPLVFTSLTVGVASLGNVKSLGRLGLTAIAYFVATTSIAIAIGMGLASLIGPGHAVSLNDAKVLGEQFHFLISDLVAQASTAPDIVRFLVEIVPDNPIHSMASENPNLLQVMFFAIMFGVALTLIPEKRSKQVLDLLDKARRVLETVMHIVMKVAPLGVACLIAQTVGFTGFSVLGAMGLYFLVVILGLAIHATGVISMAVRYLTSTRIRDFWRAIWPAELIALGTASSAATLPVTLECAEENLGVSNRVSSFAVPLGASINMDGTALFQGAAVVFIAQAFGVDLPFASLVTVFIAIILLSIGTAGVPSAGVISLALALSAVGLPPVGVALIIGFDRLLDMLRTPVNVASDLACALVVARVAGEQPHALQPDEDERAPDKGFEHRLDVPETPYRDEGGE